MRRLLFQGVNAAVAMATLVLGGMQFGFGTKSPIYGSAPPLSIPVLDSNLRFFGGMAVGLSLLVLWALPTLERRSEVVAVFWGCAFLGGVGRLVSAVTVGAPSEAMVVFAVVEVVGAPLMWAWFRSLRSALAT